MRLINICFDQHYTLPDHTNIDIRTIDKVPNFSAEYIMISFLNRIEKEQSVKILSDLCKKLKKQGKLIFSVLDFDQLIEAYHNQQLKLDDICKYTKNLQCFIHKAEIIQMFHKNTNFSIDSIKTDDIYAIYTVNRTNL